MKKINIYTDLALEERERFKRNIEISGVITGSASFDGSGDINIATSIGSVDFGEI